MSKKTFIKNLYKENATFSTERQAEMVANLLDTVSSDIYSESQRFVFELIQNADDAAKDTNNEIHFDFLPNYLIVSHNGKTFDEEDIISLTGAGSSTKRADPTKTGYKGIGFKSVFGKSEHVTIFSDGYQFRFDKAIHKTKLPWQIIPIWTELVDLSSSVQKCISEYNYAVSTIIEVRKSDELLIELNELLNNGQILLFLRKVSKISVSSNGTPICSIEKKIKSQDHSFNEVVLYNDGKEISSWITKTFEEIAIPEETKVELKQDGKTPEKLKIAEYTELSFAAKIERGKIKPLQNEESLIFTYLPTKVLDFTFPFLLNGSFLTNAAREGLHEDRIWNQWLFKLTAEKTIEWLEILANSKFKLQLLQLLPSKYLINFNELKASFDVSLENAIIHKAFVPSKNSTLKRIADIIVDRTGLSELNFISQETVIEFINQNEKTSYTKDSFIDSKLQRLDKLRMFGAKFFEPDNLESFFLSDIFKSKHQPPENFYLIEYFHDKVVKNDSREWNEKLKSIPFIYAKGKKLKSPQTVCFPSISFETEFGEGVSVIHSEVYPKIDKNSKIRGWLEQLGVKEPSDTAYLENEIIGNIDTCIDKTNYLKITRYIFNQHKKGALSEWHYAQLQNLKLYTTTNGFFPANECYLSDFYEPSLKIEKINEAGKYVSTTYKLFDDYTSEWKTLFLKIGVSENISIIHLNTSINKVNGIERSYFVEVGNEAKQGHSYPHLLGSSNPIYLDKIRYSEFAKEYKFSKLFWQQAFKTVQPSTVPNYAYMPWGYYGSKHPVKNYFQWCIENSSIFPSTDRECRKAKDLFVNDKDIIEIAGRHLAVLDYDEPLSDNWRRILPLKEKLELDDYLLILKNIAQQTEEGEVIRKYNTKTIGSIYNRIASQLKNYSKEKKEAIFQWASENKLLSVNGRFENTNELKWIKIDGFNNESERLKIIYIPDNCETNSEAFESLIALFNVQIIDEFIPTFEKAEKLDVLKNKLFEILPYFVAIIEKKQFIEYSLELKRLDKIIENTAFYKADQIKLSFHYQNEIIMGPSLNVFRKQNEFYYRGKWTNPITMFSLLPALSKLMELVGLDEELRLLLQLDEQEISIWLMEQGIILDSIHKNVHFIEAIEKAKEIKSKQIIENDGIKNPTQSIDILSIEKLLKEKNLTIEQLLNLISKIDADEDESIITISSTNHLDQKGKNEENEIARQLVFEHLSKEGFDFTNGKGNNSVVNGVNKNGIEYPLVVKSYRNTSYKFNIRPNEWLQLSKHNSMFWVHRGNGVLEVLNLEGLLRANSEFHVQFETSTFSFEGLVKFAEVFRFVRNVHFQLDAPNFSMAKAFEEYAFDNRKTNVKEVGGDKQGLLH